MQGIAVAEAAYHKKAWIREKSACSRALSTARRRCGTIIHIRREAHADDHACAHEGCRPRWQPFAAARTTPQMRTPTPNPCKRNQALYEFLVPLHKG